jgi:hypothetical protein
MKGCSFPRAFERRKQISLFREIFYEEFEICKKRPCKWAALSIGPCWGTWRGFPYWDFKRKRKCISEFLFLDPEDIKH